MELIDKVELVREKCDVSYGDAKNALEMTGGDVLDAIIWLERAGKTAPRSASYATADNEAETPVSAEMIAAQSAYRASSSKSDFSGHVGGAWKVIKRLLRKGLRTKFIATRHKEDIINVPVLVPIIGIFLWGATIWLLILGLFFDVRYRLEGVERVTVDVNDAMGKAADAVTTIKRDVTGNHD
ncbi:DUF4342 domain-containing protein [Olsenella sp. HMSC062G07]|uniref:DUF4342 domain-containing protein n=1 Tax=Olsenella sp. HMSC062G07 TaxID=1739330 RepID=UPI0008A1DF58|nr:DUF4342 domain-containing protein [Olsenella sp. HMSC062G07]OFK23281.1 ubiquitin [Olsenella sp. HMSC062G07]